jgi:hypothetical protein
MKIAFLKQGKAIPLCPVYPGKIGFVGGWTERHALFSGLVRRGHEVTIYSPIVKKTLHLLDSYPGIDYDPLAEKIADDTDLVFIEHGVDNYMYGAPGRNVPNVPWMQYLLRHYRGLVFYYHSDRDYRPALVPEAYSPVSTYQYLKYATAVDLFKGKGWVILTRAKDATAFAKDVSLPRSPVVELDLPMETWELGCYFQEFRRQPAREWERTLVYTGIERTQRRAMFDKWYRGMPEDIDVSVFGQWSDVDGLVKDVIVFF